MMNKLIKKIWFICLWFVSLTLVGCFHVPDEDWLPSRNHVDTWDIKKDEELEQAINSFMNWIDMISSWEELNDNGDIETNVEELDKIDVEAEIDIDEDENLSSDEVINIDESENLEMENIADGLD